MWIAHKEFSALFLKRLISFFLLCVFHMRVRRLFHIRKRLIRKGLEELEELEEFAIRKAHKIFLQHPRI
jgi:hypothetical protein